LAAAGLHDADRVGRPPVVGNHVLRDPEVPPTDHPPDDKTLRPARVVAAEGLHVVSPADVLPRLGIPDDGVVVADLVFRVLIARSGGRPASLHGRAGFPAPHHMHLPWITPPGKCPAAALSPA